MSGPAVTPCPECGGEQTALIGRTHPQIYCADCQKLLYLNETPPERGKEQVMAGLEIKYFVLNPRKKDAHGVASRNGMRAYADAIAHENPELAEDLRRWCTDIENEYRLDLAYCYDCGQQITAVHGEDRPLHTVEIPLPDHNGTGRAIICEHCARRKGLIG